MTVVRIVIKMKLPDSMTDKELNELFIKYVQIHPAKTCRFVKYEDWLGWLA